MEKLFHQIPLHSFDSSDGQNEVKAGGRFALHSFSRRHDRIARSFRLLQAGTGQSGTRQTGTALSVYLDSFSPGHTVVAHSLTTQHGKQKGAAELAD